jgi:hypothetical protein
MSDDEDERLPTFEEPLVLRRRLRREARERDAAAHPCVGKLLANLVDVMVLDDPKVSEQDSDRGGGRGGSEGRSDMEYTVETAVLCTRAIFFYVLTPPLFVVSP